MRKTDWRERLLTAIDADRRSDREISASAGLGENYVFQLKTKVSSPSIDAVIRLADTLGTSATFLLTGIELDAEGEEFIRLAAGLPVEQRRKLLDLLQSFAPSQD